MKFVGCGGAIAIAVVAAWPLPVAMVLSVSLWAAPVVAQNYPSKPIRLIRELS
jgi:hypothetical protein